MNRQGVAVPLGFAVLAVVLGGVAAQLAGAMVATGARSLLSAQGADAQALEHPSAVVLPAMLASSLVLLAVAAAAPLVFGRPWLAALNLRPAPAGVFVAAAVGTVALNPLGDALMRAMDALFPGATFGVLELLQGVAAEASLWLVWPVFALLPGLSEELMFRGVLQTAVGRGATAIVVSALAFSLFHADPHHIAGVVPLAFFLAWVASRVGALVTVGAHVANNTVAILALHSEALSVGYGAERPMPWYWLPVGVAIAGACVLRIARRQPRPGHSDPLNSGDIPCSSSRHVTDRSDG